MATLQISNTAKATTAIDKDAFTESISNVNINQVQPCSIYSSESETSTGPKVSSTISTLPMASPKHSADSSGKFYCYWRKVQ